MNVRSAVFIAALIALTCAPWARGDAVFGHVEDYTGRWDNPWYPPVGDEIFNMIDFETNPPVEARGYFIMGTGGLEWMESIDSVQQPGHTLRDLGSLITIDFIVGPGANPDWHFAVGFALVDGLSETTIFSAWDPDGNLLGAPVYVTFGSQYNDPDDAQFLFVTNPDGIGGISIEQLGPPIIPFEIDDVQWMTIPEPATLALLGIGTVILLRRKSV